MSSFLLVNLIQSYFMKRQYLQKILAVLLSAFMPLVAFAQVTIETLIVSFAELINLLVPVLITAALVVFIWGAVRYIGAKSDENKIKEGRNFLIFGVLGIAVMVSVRGLDSAQMPDIPLIRI